MRSQHYAVATATKPTYAVTPLFWVIGQCLAISAISSLALWLRVNLFMYVFVAMATSMIVLTSAVLVEFNEIVFNPQDLPVIGPRPVSPRTYSAARFFNLMLYVLVLTVSLNIFPTIVGAGMDDAGPWYVPAFLTASISASLITVCVTVLLLSAVGRSETLEQWKAFLAWTQIILFAIAAYGGQLMFRRHDHAVEVWLAFPPEWVYWLPPAWFARFVDVVCDVPSVALVGTGAVMLMMTAALCLMTVWRLASLYRDMQPLPVTVKERFMPPERVGAVSRSGMMLAASTREQRVGFWLCSRALWQNAALRMRCLYPLNVSLAIVLVGLLSQQFENPLVSRDLSLTLLPILSVYLTAAAVPVIVLNLTFTEGHEAAWILRTAPLPDPSGIAVGGAKSIQLWVMTPLCLLLAVVMLLTWHDPWAAVGHAFLMWLMSWLCAMAALWLVVPDLPLSQPAARGSSLGPAVVPLAAFTCAASLLTGLHYQFSANAVFWVSMIPLTIIAATLFRILACRRLNRIFAGAVR